MNTLTKKITVNVSKEDAWDLLFNQFSKVSNFNPLVTDSSHDSGVEGEVGAVRTCDLNAKTTIKERIVSAAPMERFDFEVIEGAMPMVSQMHAAYSLKAIDTDRTEITFTVKFTSRPGFLGGMMKIMMGMKFMKMLTGLKQYLETTKTSTPGL